MPLKFKKKALVAKTETVYGTDAIPTGAANAILTSDLSITPLEADTLDRNIDQNTFGNTPQGLTNKRVRFTFKVELTGSGAAGTAPGYGPLLRACGFGETITPTTDVVYLPVSSGHESATLYVDMDGILHKMTGARGNVKMTINAGAYPMLDFDFVGLFNPVVAGSIVDPDWSGFLLPDEVNNTNTTSFSLHGYAAIMTEFEIDMANEVEYMNRVGLEQVNIGDRKPSLTTTFEAPTIAAKDFFAGAVSRATGALQLVHGLTPGQIVQIDCPKVELDAPSYQDDRGDLMMSIAGRPLNDAGDDDVKLTIK